MYNSFPTVKQYQSTHLKLPFSAVPCSKTQDFQRRTRWSCTQKPQSRRECDTGRPVQRRNIGIEVKDKKGTKIVDKTEHFRPGLTKAALDGTVVYHQIRIRIQIRFIPPVSVSLNGHRQVYGYTRCCDTSKLSFCSLMKRSYILT